MTCLFDLDYFNTRRFKPCTGKTLVCANYVSKSGGEGGRMLSSASKRPHLLAVEFGGVSTLTTVNSAMPSSLWSADLLRIGLGKGKVVGTIPSALPWMLIGPSAKLFQISSDKV